MSLAFRLAGAPLCRRRPEHLVRPLRSHPAGLSASRTFATAAVLRYAQQDSPPPTSSSTSPEVKAPSSSPKSLFQRLNEPEPETAPPGIPASKEKGSIELHENIYTIPNLLTVSRILACPALGYFIVKGDFVLATGLLVYAGTTDFIDGWLARKYNMGSVFGSILDPAADKALMTTLTIALAIKGLLPVSLAVLILGRDVALSISAFYFRYISLPEPKTFKRYWDFSIPSAEVKPTQISKYNTFLQLVLMGVTTVSPLSPYDITLPLQALQVLVAGTTVWSGLSYVGGRQGLKILDNAAKAKANGTAP